MMAGLSDLLGSGGVAEQLLTWQLLGQAISAALAPYLSQLQQDVQQLNPVEPLSPADAANAVVRNFLGAEAGAGQAARNGVDPATFATLVALAGDAPGPQQLAEGLLRGLIAPAGTGAGETSFAQGIAEGRLADKWAPLIQGLSVALLSPADAASAVVRNFLGADAGVSVAAKSGVDAETFATLVRLSGDAPGPQQLAEALRRGAIPADGSGPDSISFTQGIAEGRLSDKWAPVIQDLARIWPTPVNALEGMLKGQLTTEEGTALYAKLGGDPQFLTWLLDSQGDGPTPLQAAEWARRGIIPWDGVGPGVVSYAQAVKESRYRDKWADAYRASEVYVPPPSTVITLLKDRAVDKATAADWLKKSGVDDAGVAAFIAEADTETLSAYRGLTTSAVLNMYYERLITPSDATDILTSLHVSAEAAPLMLTYADLQRAIAQQRSAVTRVGSLYAARKITAQTAQASLVRLQVPATAVDDIMSTWKLENSIHVKVLTEAQIIDAWEYKIMDDNTAMTELQNIGYTPYDAWVLLSIKAKAPLPGQPGSGPGAAQDTVIPGVT